MQRQWRWPQLSGLGALLALALAMPVAAAEVDDPTETPETPSLHLLVAEAKPTSDWWLGVQCRPIDEALRSHLGLSEAGGLVVEKTVPNSPAAKAGLERHDVLLSVEGKPLKSPQDLIEAVNGAEGKPLTLKCLHNAQERELTLTPEHRPDWARAAASDPRTAQESEMVRKWLEQLQAASPGAPMRFRFLHPGTILPPDAPAHPPLPAGVSVTITKHGSDLARVIVTRDNDKWDVAENELDKLPKDLVPYAELMLGRVWPGSKGAVRLFEVAPDSPPPAVETPEQSPHPSLEERLEKMNQQLEQLQHSVDALRQQRNQ